jgi:hypothetical protein
MKATKGGNFNAVELPEPQTALARCYSVIDIGTVKNIYKNEDKGWHRMLNITWEFPSLLAAFNPEKGEEPFVIGKEIAATTGPQSNFSKLIAAWRNKSLTAAEQDGFDTAQLVGKTAYISFSHKRKLKYATEEIDKVTNENTNLKFMAIMPKPKDIEAPPNRNAYMVWDWDLVEKEGFEQHKAIFEKIPKWLQRKMTESQEFKKFAGGYKVDKDSEDDVQGQGQPQQGPPKKTVGDDW